MQTAPIDLSLAAEAALIGMLENGRIVGRDSHGRRVIEVAVDDWIVDWFSQPRARSPRRRA